MDLYKKKKKKKPCACMHACMCAFVNFFFKKTSPQKLLTGLLPNFIVVFLRWRLKSSLHHNKKMRPVELYRHSGTSSSKQWLFQGHCYGRKNCGNRRKCCIKFNPLHCEKKFRMKVFADHKRNVINLLPDNKF